VRRHSLLRWNNPPFDVRPFLGSTRGSLRPIYVTDLGALFAGDCLAVLPQIKSESVDTVFADPPFNLGKEYGKNSDDARPDYLSWCRTWLDECVRVLKPGGSIFVYNLPKWNVSLGAHLGELGMEFRHWIAIDLAASLPIIGRLHPSHYSLIYYTKGMPKTFKRIRTPIQLCRHCGGEVRDYGGHRGAMNPNGVTLKDVWSDIPPVRHWKYKAKARRANALSTKILYRVINMSTTRGEVVLDPFCGSGTTAIVCEEMHRRWIGIEIDFAKEIVERLESDEIKSHPDSDWVES